MFPSIAAIAFGKFHLSLEFAAILKKSSLVGMGMCEDCKFSQILWTTSHFPNCIVIQTKYKAKRIERLACREITEIKLTHLCNNLYLKY